MSEGSEGLELPVWLGGCEKWVTGLTKRTTCDDVLYALLKHDGNPNDDDLDISGFCIFERWRDVERPLRGRTKILKVWRAWGDECRNVRFSVRKVDVPQDTSSEVSRTRRSRKHYSARERRSREKTRGRPISGTSGSGVHRKDYGPIDGNGMIDNRYKAQAFHDLVQLVIEQEKKIQDQLTRMRETDTQIENYETKMHELRMRENGENYVQEAYLRERGEDSGSSGGEELFPAIKANDLEAYMHICENILDLEERITGEQSRVLNLSHKIQEESILEAPPTPPRPAPCPPPPVECRQGAGGGPLQGAGGGFLTPVPEDRLQEEVERLRSELQRSQTLTEAQQHQLSLVEMTMSELDTKISQKADYMNRMLYEMNIAENATAAPPPPGREGGYTFFPQDRNSSSTSGVSEVSEMEGSDRSTSRSRQGDSVDSRSRDRLEERISSIRDKSRDRSTSVSSSRGRSGSVTSRGDCNSSRSNRTVTFSRDLSGSMSALCGPQSQLPSDPHQTRTYPNRPPLPPPPHPHTLNEEYYVTKTYYPPPSSYRDAYLNQPKTLSDDSNSDTGLSSLHSDEAPPILETLV